MQDLVYSNVPSIDINLDAQRMGPKRNNENTELTGFGISCMCRQA